MGILDILKRRPKVEGAIGHYNLGSWWVDTFTEAEQNYIDATYRPLGLTPGVMRGPYGAGSQTVAGFLFGLAGWFKKSGDRHLARRLLTKAEELLGSGIFDRHFLYSEMIPIYYPDRDKEEDALANAIRACEMQIAIEKEAASAFRRAWGRDELPSHRGFKQLAIIREKEKNYSEAIRLSRTAFQRGWAGDWEKRIERCERRETKVKRVRNKDSHPNGGCL